MIPVFCGRSLVVKHQLPKLSVASSILVTRSIYAYQLQAFGLELFYLPKKLLQIIFSASILINCTLLTVFRILLYNKLKKYLFNCIYIL